jgi:CHC2 zinc finger
MNSVPQAEESRTRRYQGVSYTRPIDAAKEAVQVIDLADRLCGPGGLRRVGKERVGRCVLPSHEDRSPSFTVNPEKNVFFCHGCVRGGDVVELARLAWGYDQRDAHVAAAMLLMEFGYEIPQRSPAWFRKQERQKPIDDAVEETIRGNFRRRVFKYIVLPCLQLGDAPAERKGEIAAAWKDFEASMRRIGR